MRVVQLDGYGSAEALYVGEAETPIAGPGMVRIRVRAAAVNPADHKWRAGLLHAILPLRFPQVLGYDIAGTVDALGQGVTAMAAGDRVVAMLSHTEMGGYAEYAIVPEAHAVPIPDALGFATAAAIPTASLTGVQMIEEHVRPAAGDTVLITGALGGVGRLALHAARARGCRVIAAVRRGQIEDARALGAAEVIVLGEDAGTGTPFAHVADTVGGPAVATLCRRVSPGGRICTAATSPIDPEGLPSVPIFTVVHQDPARLGALARAIVAGELVMPVARRLPFEAAPEAHRLAEKGATGGKIILEP